MQRVKPKMSRRKAFLVLFLILAGVGLLVWGGISLFSVRVVTNVTASLLPCPYSDTIMPFGQNVLYYDGVSIHCMSDTGSVRWSFQRMAGRTTWPCSSSATMPCIWPDNPMAAMSCAGTLAFANTARMDSTEAAHQSCGFCCAPRRFGRRSSAYPRCRRR